MTKNSLRKLPRLNDRCHRHLIHLFILDKKKQIIRFAVLATEDDNDIQLDITNVSKEIDESIACHQEDPPLYIQNINNFSALKNTLVQLIGHKGFVLLTCVNLLFFIYPS